MNQQNITSSRAPYSGQQSPQKPEKKAAGTAGVPSPSPREKTPPPKANARQPSAQKTPNNSAQKPPKPVRKQQKPEKASGSTPKPLKPQKKPTPQQKTAEGRNEMRKRISTQTPSNRKTQANAKRRRNLESLRRANVNKSETFHLKKKKKRFSLRAAIRYTAFTAAIYLFFSACIAGVLFFNLIRNYAQNADTVYFRIGKKTESNYVKINYTYGTLFRNGVMYVNFSQIAEYCELTATGTPERLRYYNRAEDGNVATFEVGTKNVDINGTKIILSAPSFLKDEELYLPSDFLSSYMNGVTCTFNDDYVLQVTRASLPSIYADLDYQTVTFKIRPNDPTDPISYMSLDDAVRYEIEHPYEYDLEGEDDEPSTDDPAAQTESAEAVPDAEPQ